MDGPLLETAEGRAANVLAQAFDAAPNGFVLINEHGQIIAANQELARMFGHPPAQLVGRSVDTLVPEALQGDQLTLEGQRIELIGHDPKHRSLWIPSIQAVVGGVLTYANIHPWIADAQTPEARQTWLKSLDELQALQPKTLVPGHFMGQPKLNLDDLRFTRNYLNDLETALPKAKNSQALIEAMKAQYPDLLDASSLELSAKVLKGEMQWP